MKGKRYRHNQGCWSCKYVIKIATEVSLTDMFCVRNEFKAYDYRLAAQHPQRKHWMRTRRVQWSGICDSHEEM